MEGTYCYGDDFMSARASATDLQRRFSACFFNQWIGNTMTNQVDPTYPWAENPTGGVFTPYTNGLVGAHLAIGAGPLLPAERGLDAVGNIIRGNALSGFTLGVAYTGGNGPLPSPMPVVGRDNVIDQNQTQSVPVGVFVGAELPGTLVREDACDAGCTTQVDNANDGG
jgi:hypothetical protein